MLRAHFLSDDFKPRFVKVGEDFRDERRLLLELTVKETIAQISLPLRSSGQHRLGEDGLAWGKPPRQPERGELGVHARFWRQTARQIDFPMYRRLHFTILARGHVAFDGGERR